MQRVAKDGLSFWIWLHRDAPRHSGKAMDQDSALRRSPSFVDECMCPFENLEQIRFFHIGYLDVKVMHIVELSVEREIIDRLQRHSTKPIVSKESRRFTSTCVTESFSM